MNKKQIIFNKEKIFLFMLLSYCMFSADAKNPLCFIDDRENYFTSQDCIENRTSFFDDPDQSIGFFLSYYAKWSASEVKKLLNIKNVKKRYLFFVKNNKSDFKLECEQGFILPKQYKDCKQPLFGNLVFQMDYLLCPNLVGRYHILTAHAWSGRLNDLFVYCAQSNQLPEQCATAPKVLITKPTTLKQNTHTLTAREICQFSSVYHFQVQRIKHHARYQVYFLMKP